jgi:ubiquinone/menaquinone biosynthesis C-methylase UbiE
MIREIATVEYGSIAPAYAEHREIHPNVLRSLIRGGVVEAHRNVVEVGCGTGNYMLALVEATDCHGWGVDPDDEMLRIARQRGRRVGFSQGSADALRLPSTSFDFVFSVDMIHNVEDLDAAFQEAHASYGRAGRSQR